MIYLGILGLEETVSLQPCAVLRISTQFFHKKVTKKLDLKRRIKDELNLKKNTVIRVLMIMSILQGAHLT